jgi:hypothetical protein
MTEAELRMHTIVPGDPVGAYYGFPETQREIIADEAERGVAWVNGVEIVPVILVTPQQPAVGE